MPKISIFCNQIGLFCIFRILKFPNFTPKKSRNRVSWFPLFPFRMNVTKPKAFPTKFPLSCSSVLLSLSYFSLHFHCYFILSLFLTSSGEMEKEVSEPKAVFTSLRAFTNFTLTVAAFTKWWHFYFILRWNSYKDFLSSPKEEKKWGVSKSFITLHCLKALKPLWDISTHSET